MRFGGTLCEAIFTLCHTVDILDIPSRRDTVELRARFVFTATAFHETCESQCCEESGPKKQMGERPSQSSLH